MATAPLQQQQIRPIAAPERIEVVDLLRGWALFGILTVNFEFFAWPLTFMFLPHSWPSPADAWTETVMKVLFQGKFYTLFSFLFGFGFSTYLRKRQAGGKSPIPVYARRLLVLLAIGAAHAYLVWMGDILLVYALTGFVLLLFRNAKPKTLLIWVTALLVLPAAMMGFGAFAAANIPEAAAEIAKDTAQNQQRFRELEEAALRVYPNGSFAEITAQRAWEYNTMFSFMVFFAPGILAMFLLGLWAGKTGLFENVEQKLSWFNRARWIGLAVGLPGSIWTVWAVEQAGMLKPSYLGAAAALAGAFANPALSAFYAFTLVLLFRDAAWRRRLEPARAAGRMALTNYLMQSLICTTIFYGYGLGYFGKVGMRWLPLFVLAIYALELAWSVRWMRAFEFGPAEWLWRSLTYGKPQPMRRRA